MKRQFYIVYHPDYKTSFTGSMLEKTADQAINWFLGRRNCTWQKAKKDGWICEPVDVIFKEEKNEKEN
jgi:hypothetical protein